MIIPPMPLLLPTVSISRPSKLASPSKWCQNEDADLSLSASLALQTVNAVETDVLYSFSVLWGQKGTNLSLASVETASFGIFRS